MKKINLFFLFSVFAFVVSCSGDDDSTAQGYFPTKIEFDLPSTPSASIDFDFSYNSNNQISQIVATEDDGKITTLTINYSGSLISNIVYDHNFFGTSNFSYTYTDGILTEFTEEYDDVTEVNPVDFDPITKTYSITDFEFSLDESNNLVSFESFGSEFQIDTDTSKSGPFKNVKAQPALLLYALSSKSWFDELYFFSPYEVNQWGTSSVVREVANTRDANNNISEATYTRTTPSSDGILQITYTKRNL